nr:putative protein ORF2/3 [Torque teno virus]
MSDWIPPTQNVPDREEAFFRGVYCMHRAFCGCGDFVHHLARLSADFGYQPGPAPHGDSGPRATPGVVRGLRALPAASSTPRDPPCGGGDGGRAGGEGRQDAGEDGGDGDDLAPGDIEELVDLLDDPETSKTPQIRGPRAARRRLRFTGQKITSLARRLGERERSRSPPRRRTEETDTGAARTATQRAEAARKNGPAHHPPVSKDPASPPRTHYPLVGPKAYLFPTRLPQVWTKQDWETEYQAAAAWDRPARNNLHSPPFYPWMPREPPKVSVSFKLGFKP